MVLQVHRGVYNAAELLYQRFLPMVEEQLASSPFAKIAFTVRHHMSNTYPVVAPRMLTIR